MPKIPSDASKACTVTPPSSACAVGQWETRVTAVCHMPVAYFQWCATWDTASSHRDACVWANGAALAYPADFVGVLALGLANSTWVVGAVNALRSVGKDSLVYTVAKQ